MNHVQCLIIKSFRRAITMAITTFKSDVKWSGEGVLSKAQMNQHEVLIDEPESLGGKDQGANPVEYILAALGGCINVLVTSFAEQFDVQVDDVHVHLEGDLDPDGFLGKNPDVRPGYEEIRYEVTIDSPSAQEKIDALLAHVDKVCPVKDTLTGTNVVNQKSVSAK